VRPLGVSRYVRGQGGRAFSRARTLLPSFRPYRGAVRDVQAGERAFKENGLEGFDRLLVWGPKTDRSLAYRYGFELARRRAEGKAL